MCHSQSRHCPPVYRSYSWISYNFRAVKYILKESIFMYIMSTSILGTSKINTPWLALSMKKFCSISSIWTHMGYFISFKLNKKTPDTICNTETCGILDQSIHPSCILTVWRWCYVQMQEFIPLLGSRNWLTQIKIRHYANHQINQVRTRKKLLNKLEPANAKFPQGINQLKHKSIV